MSNGRAESRFRDTKRQFPKPIPVSSQVLLDRERCVQCARCTRFSQQIAGDPFIELFERGALEQVGTAEGEPFQSYFSGNTVQICPVGALTGASYRFRARPFDLVSTPSTCEHCASGCSQRNDHRRGKVTRRLAGDDPEVNEEWNCDKGRWAFQYAWSRDRLTTPLVRGADGVLHPTSWPEALEAAADGLRRAREAGGVGVLAGGRLTLEDSYAYAKFARVALGTNDVDFRARPGSDEELEFLAAQVAGTSVTDGGVTYRDLEDAPVVLLAGFEPEEESPIVFLRLRKAWVNRKLPVYAIAPYATRGLVKVGGTLIPTPPGAEPRELQNAAGGALGDLLRTGGAVILVGERLAEIPGGLAAAATLARDTGARLAWVPRRAGERGAVEAGALPTLLPGGRPVADAAARGEIEAVWGTAIAAERGRSTTEILAALADGTLGGAVIGGVDPEDLPDPRAAELALEAAGFVVSLELRHSAVTARADVVLPVAASMEKAGTFVNWEGRSRPFGITLNSGAITDGRVLDWLAVELDPRLAALGTADVERIRAEISRLGAWHGDRASAPVRLAMPPGRPQEGQALLATWTHLLDAGRMQDGEEHLAGTRRTPVARTSPATAAEIGVKDGDVVRVGTDHGAVDLPLEVTDMPDRVVWVPTNSVGSQVRRALAAHNGAVVTISAAKEAYAS
jgi:NADH-quinone oxidoreductase subunit G